MAKPKQKKSRYHGHRTQWAAQFAVGSELIKRGYEIAFTMGNHPQKDLMAISPRGISVVVDVKGLREKNAWPMHQLNQFIRDN